MSENIAFSVMLDPRGKGRPRAAVIHGRAKIYTDAATRKYELVIRKFATKLMGDRRPLEGPLSVSLRFRLSPPVSMSKRQRAAVLAGEQPYFGRIDCDNAAKSVLDACNAVCWGDDKQIVRLFVTKVAAEKPGVDVHILALAPQELAA